MSSSLIFTSYKFYVSVAIRPATLADLEEIHKLGMSYPDFAVNKRIRFYEKSDIREWIAKKSQNVFLVADSNGKIVGFSYAKIMSYYWAVIDGFFIAPRYRRRGIGTELLHRCTAELKKHGVDY